MRDTGGAREPGGTRDAGGERAGVSRPGGGSRAAAADSPAPPTTTGAPTATSDAATDSTTYTLLRDRLRSRAAELTRRVEELDGARVEEFGASGLAISGTGRLRTQQPLVPRDLVAVGQDVLLLGHDRGGAPARGATTVGDVFSLYDRELRPLPHTAVPGLFDDPAFVREFVDLHRYFQGARLLRLRHVEGRLLAVFRTGERAEDIRVLRWALTPGAGPAAPSSQGPRGQTVRFLDALGERDHTTPEPYDFTWTRTTREDHVPGRFPHISVAGGAVFVSTVGGSLTVKTEDDTESATGVHSEPVQEPLQSLADAEVSYAVVGPLVLLRVRPYKETRTRHLLFHPLTRAVVRLDALAGSARRLPEDQGLVFPGGYALATGEIRTFDTPGAPGGEDGPPLAFEQVVTAPGGEDVLYVFRAHPGGRALLLPYHLIRKEIAAPLSCHGHALLDDGTLLALRAAPGEPGHVHPVQLWDTPFCSDLHAADRAAEGAAEGADGAPLRRIGNAELVRGISDCLASARQATGAVGSTTAPAGADETAGPRLRALIDSCDRAADRHPWLTDPGVGALRAALDAVREAAAGVLAEYASVHALTRQAATALEAAADELHGLVRRVRGEAPAEAGEWVERIASLRRAQGRALTLKELPHVATDTVDALAAEAGEQIAATARRALAFLRRADAFAPQHALVEEFLTRTAEVTDVEGATALTARVDAQILGLRTLTEVVTGLDAADAPTRTAVLERVADVLAGLNRARARLTSRARELRGTESGAAFAAEFALLGQAVTGALAAADTPEHCETQLASLLSQLDTLEARFAEHDAFLAEIGDKRTEVHDAFSGRRQSLQDERARRAERLAESGARVLRTVARRAAQLADSAAVAAYFASDPMPVKVRRVAEQLREHGDPVRAGELEGRLKAAGQEAVRALRDRAELYADDGATVRLGAHHFAVTTREPELTLVPDGQEDGGLVLALSGTDYRAPVTDDGFAGTRPYWEQLLPSENRAVYRAEHLAARLLDEHGAPALDTLTPDELAALVGRSAREAYDEGYERGVHDHDATALLRAVLGLWRGAGLLRHPAADRAAAQLFWAHGTREDQRAAWTRTAVSLVRARETFGAAPAGLEALRAELVRASGTWPLTSSAAAYLVEELAASAPGGGGGRGGVSFCTGPAARALLDKFARTVGTSPGGSGSPYAGEVRERLAAGDPGGALRIAEGWLGAYAAASGERYEDGDLAEALAIETCLGLDRHTVDAPLGTTVQGLLGSHPRIGRHGELPLRLDEFLARTEDFRARAVPGFRAYQRRRAALLAAERERLRLDEYRPRVLSSFVRGRLVDEVYLPLIGDNLAKQLGAAGDARRTDSSGLLLLLSPPGYGKTSLMEYVAERLGLLLVKVDGPSIGHEVTSLDPGRAGGAAARRELEKVAFALAAGGNVLLHLDDIQHLSPELLQKFIPLCDATRTLDGHDLRGKRFAVCMTGNPYTESGHAFRVPDMLANRADVWNLGEVLHGKEEAFALSFVENALTSHPVLAPLAGRDLADLGLLVRVAAGDPGAHPGGTAHPYEPAERERVLAVLRHLLAARRTVLAVNSAYIASAGVADSARTEPPFLLQGSYRDMNKIVSRLSPAMDAAELDALVTDHYTAQAQTLAGGAEAALLKLAALRGTLDEEGAERWAQLSTAYVRDHAPGAAQDEAVVRAVAALGLLADRIAAVESAITRARGVAAHAPGPRGAHRSAGAVDRSAGAVDPR